MPSAFSLNSKERKKILLQIVAELIRNSGGYIYELERFVKDEEKEIKDLANRKKETFDSHPKEIWHTPVLQYNLNGIFIQEHYNGATASRNTGLFHSSISLCCKGKAKQCGGFIFKFKYNE
ncbi:MAG: hypothetical protein AABY22_31530 [Nanoarchaeota archaeon]